MKYIYDIYLNFNDYPINYYEWDESDTLERVLKIPIIKVDDIEPFISFNMVIEDYDDKIIVSDGINALALEIIDSKVAYVSYLTYDDELCVCELARTMPITRVTYHLLERRNIPSALRKDALMQKILLSKIDLSGSDELKYIYYEITNKDSSNLDKIKKFLKVDIEHNFNQKYVNLYEKIYK